MNALDIFALIVLIVLVVAALAIWAMLGMYPGKIARQRNHPQADAIAVCGWWGAITLGILTPLAFIWAYSNPEANLVGSEAAASQPEPESTTGEGDES
jgi:fatty acid desaturase